MSDYSVVSTHQANHARIIYLRERISTLNQEITANLVLLTDTRDEINATPATVFPDNQRIVPYDELLDYAKRISRFTVPPTFRPPISSVQEMSADSSEPTNPLTTNGASTTEPSMVQPPKSKETQGIGVASLNQNEIQWLDPLTQIPFVPWPVEEVIRQGALAQIQVMLEQGIDPSNVRPGENECPKAEAFADNLTVSKSHDTKLGGIGGDGNAKVGNGIVFKKEEEKPKVFGGLDLYDPDEEG